MSTALLEAPIREFADVTHDMELEVPKGFEYVDGMLQEMEVSYLSNYVASEISFHLKLHTKSKNLGWVASEGASFQCFSDDAEKVRRADVAFHRRNRLTRTQASEGHCRVAPDLVVEVVSPNDEAYKVERKRREWLKAGVQLVWLVYPEDQTLLAFYADGSSKVFDGASTLTAAPVLPEFEVPLADLFVLPDDVEA